MITYVLGLFIQFLMLCFIQYEKCFRYYRRVPKSIPNIPACICVGEKNANTP